MRSFVLVALLASCLLPGRVAAQDYSGVVLGFSGTDAEAARKEVISQAKTLLILKTRSDALAEARRSRANIKTEKGRATLAGMMGLDFVIFGKVRGSAENMRTEIRIAGFNGQVLASVQAKGPNTASGRRDIRRKTYTTIQRAIKIAIEREADAGSPEEEAMLDDWDDVTPIIVKPPKPEPAPKAEPKPRRPVRKAQVEEEEEEEEEKELTPRKAPKVRVAKDHLDLPIFVGLVGGGTRFRLTDIKTILGSREYRSNAFGEIGVHFQLRPGAHAEHIGLRGIYVQLDADFGVGLESVPQDTVAKLDTVTYRILGQVGYLYPFKNMQVGLMLGAGVDQFKIDDNTILPSSTYVLMRIGTAIQYTFISDFLFGRLDIGLRVPFTLGDFEDAFGTRSTGIGYDIGLMLGGKLEIGFTYAMRFGWDRIDLDFKGSTAGTHPADATGVSGKDQNLSLQFLVGWSL